ncbi:methyltransferase [Sorangium sp. So ce1078]|uniref:methyltransferase n=1 Tax=Sorangium sp. So ce1078 TaxID=3133329 RepID=UPI003F630A5C
MTHPKQTVLETISGRWRSQTLYAGARLGLFDALGGGASAAEDVADQLHLNRRATYRLMRALACLGFMTESPDRSFALTEAGSYLRSDHPESLRGVVLLEEGPEHYAAWKHLSEVVRDGGENGFQRELGRPVFLHVAGDERYGRVFNEAMTSYSASETAMFLEALGGRALADVKTLCDVGGGHGHLLCSVLARYPHLRGTVLDLAPTFEDESALWARRMGVESRCAYVAGDMFKQVPAADAYLLKHVLHDWNDAECVQILSRIRGAANDGARLFVAEFIVTDAATPHFAKLFDIHMMCVSSGEERTAAEYGALFEKSGWRYVDARHSSFGPISVVEAEIAA